MGETTASHLSIYSAFVEVVSGIFSDGKGSRSPTSKPITEDLSKATPEHFAARVNSMLSI